MTNEQLAGFLLSLAQGLEVLSETTNELIPEKEGSDYYSEKEKACLNAFLSLSCQMETMYWAISKRPLLADLENLKASFGRTRALEQP